MSFWEMFHGNKQQPQQQPQPQIQQPPGPLPAGTTMNQSNPGTDPNKMVQQPSGTAANGTPQPTEGTGNNSPLDTFKDIWQAPANPQQGDQSNQPLLQVDSTKLTEAARKVNFLQGVQPDAIQKALGGDANEFMRIINTATQNAFALATQASVQSIQQGVDTYDQRLNSQLDKRIRTHTLNSTKSENPVLNHPAAQPMLQATKLQLAQKHPDLSAAEVNRMAEEYLTTFAASLTSSKQPVQDTRQSAEDFSNWA